MIDVHSSMCVTMLINVYMRICIIVAFAQNKQLIGQDYFDANNLTIFQSFLIFKAHITLYFGNCYSVKKESLKYIYKANKHISLVL